MKVKKFILYMFISVLVFQCTNINVRAAEVVPQEQVSNTEEVSNTNVAPTVEVKQVETVSGAAVVKEAEIATQADVVTEAEAVKETKAVNEVKTAKKVDAVKKAETVKKDTVVKTAKADKQVKKVVKKTVKKYTAAELRLLSTIIYCEANSEKYNGKLAVGIVVMNRVRSSLYPDTVKEVIYQKYQFSPARSGSLDKALADYDKGGFTSDMEKECIKAAKAALSGEKSITVNGKKKDFSKFLSFSCSTRGYTFQLGNHQFK